ncbi:MAG: malonate transporter [Enterobacterales bacterium]|jgi:malonate transporter
MLENIAIIAPIYIIMMVGFVMGKTDVFPEGSGAARTFSTFTWYVAIPALIFKLLSSNRFPAGEEFLNVAGYYFVLYIIYFINVFLVAPKLNINKEGRGIFAISCVFGNLGFIGIPIIEGTLGNEGLRILLMIISFHMLTLLPITAFIIEMSKPKSDSAWKVLSKSILKSIQNPVVISLVAGLSWSASGLDLSPIAIRILDFPAASAAPVGLFAVGLSLSRVKLKGELLPASIPVIFKMVLLPIGVYSMMTFILDAPLIWVNTLTLAACMPTGFLAYSIADQNNNGATRASSTIMIAAIVSSFSLLIAVSLLK